MTNEPVKHKEIIAAEWTAMLESLRAQAQAAPTRALLAATVGDEALEAYLGGQVGIGRFAKLVGFPVTTVRHYVELGLLRPYRLNGKFRFALPNQLEFMDVRQWVDMGMGLEEIAARIQANPAMPRVLPKIQCDLPPDAVVTAVRFPNQPEAGGGEPSEAPEASFARLGVDLQASLQQTVNDTDAQIAALEDKQGDLTLKLERARTLKASLETVRDAKQTAR
jgi:DNA-binding transcriptional MerR regulator